MPAQLWEGWKFQRLEPGPESRQRLCCEHCWEQGLQSGLDHPWGQLRTSYSGLSGQGDFPLLPPHRSPLETLRSCKEHLQETKVASLVSPRMAAAAEIRYCDPSAPPGSLKTPERLRPLTGRH